MDIPEYALTALDGLNQSGFEAYLVGGCVRDTLLGREIYDIDITTNAKPDEILNVFKNRRCIPTGIAHGTVTVIIDDKPLEITTYRIDGEYLDNRHPESVSFSDNIESDLSRRDFTVNAMAYSPGEGFRDSFGGREDLYNKIIRAVGNPDERFKEDGLRIMRALRFASQLGFEIEKETSDAIFRNKELLKNIAVERLSAELIKLLCGKDAGKILSKYGEVIFVFIPELADEYNHPQYGKKHAYDIWNHTCHTVDGIENDKVLRLTMLLHDCGKPVTEKFDENGDSTFKNHAAAGGEIAAKIVKRLRLDNQTADLVTFLVTNHDKKVPTDKIAVKKYLRDLGEENFDRMMKIRKADRGALSSGFSDISDMLETAFRLRDEVMANGECYSLKQLAVKGKDVAPYTGGGEDIGKTLSEILNLVIEEKLVNTKSEIINYLKERK